MKKIICFLSVLAITATVISYTHPKDQTFIKKVQALIEKRKIQRHINLMAETYPDFYQEDDTLREISVVIADKTTYYLDTTFRFQSVWTPHNRLMKDITDQLKVHKIYYQVHKTDHQHNDMWEISWKPLYLPIIPKK